MLEMLFGNQNTERILFTLHASSETFLGAFLMASFVVILGIATCGSSQNTWLNYSI